MGKRTGSLVVTPATAPTPRHGGGRRRPINVLGAKLRVTMCLRGEFTAPRPWSVRVLACFDALRGRAGRGVGGAVKRFLSSVGLLSVMLGSQLVGSAAAEEATPTCGPPGQEVLATIVGSGTVMGTSGADVIVSGDGNDLIWALGGNDIVCAGEGNDVVRGGYGDDVLIGDGIAAPPFAPSNGANDDTLIGGYGDDVLAGLGGNDTLRGGDGDDELIGFGGNDWIRGASGDDTAFGGPGDDTILGDRGADTLWGNYGSDLIRGGAGNDTIDGDNPFPPPPDPLPFPPGGNTDTCFGGDGDDAVTNCEVT